MKLSPSEKLVLGAIIHRADLPLSEVGKLIGMRADTVRHTVQRLEEKKVLLQKVPFLNTYLFGREDYTVYFSSSYDIDKKLLKFVSNLSTVSWWGLLSGSFQGALSLSVDSAAKAKSSLNEIISKYPEFIRTRALVVNTRFTSYGRRYLAPKVPGKPFVAETRQELFELDETDKKLLSWVSLHGMKPVREIGQVLGLNGSSIVRRFARLEEEKVILGYLYRAHVPTLQVLQYRILITIEGDTEVASKALHTLAKTSLEITGILETIGSWDFEVLVEVEQAEEAIPVVQQIYTMLGSRVRALQQLQLFRVFLYRPYVGLGG